MAKPDPDARETLTAIAQGFRKRTLANARLAAAAGLRLAKRNFAAREAVSAAEDAGAVEAAEALLRELEQLRGLPMKIGQMMSYLDHSLSPRARAVLARLQSEARPMDADTVAEVIRGSLGADPARLFTRFDPTPFASASIGQVHRAWVGERAVAVKVQFPGIDTAMATDVASLRVLARLGTAFSPVDGPALVDELGQRLREECDYALEAEHLRRFRGLFGGPEVEVPAVIASHTGAKVLTTDFVDRARFDAFRASADQATRTRAAEAIYRAVFVSIFGHAAYNADPHPGNYLFAPDGAVTLLDFGCVKYFSADFVERWKRLARSVLDEDRATFARAFTDVGLVGRARGFDFDHQFEAMRFLYRPMTSREPFTFDPGYLTELDDRLVFQNKNKLKFGMPPEWLLLNRLQFGLYAVLMHLGAGAVWGRHFREALAMDVRPLATLEVRENRPEPPLQRDETPGTPRG